MRFSERSRIMRQATEGHLSLPDNGMMATRANVKAVVAHLTSRAGTDDYAAWAAEVQKHFSGSVRLGKYLMDF